MANKLTTLRSLNTDFARTYKYGMTIAAQDKAASLKGLSNPSLGDVKTLLDNSLLTVAVPSSGTQMIETSVGMYTMKLPGKKEVGGVINPEFLLTGDYKLYKFFRSWNNLMSTDAAGLGGDGNNAEGVNPYSYLALADIDILGYDVANATKLTIKLYNCWCRNAPEITFSDDTNDIIRWSPEIVYEFSKVG
jgi:hypothetical protein